jgi:hypothetical protein
MLRFIIVMISLGFGSTACMTQADRRIYAEVFGPNAEASSEIANEPGKAEEPTEISKKPEAKSSAAVEKKAPKSLAPQAERDKPADDEQTW